MTVRRFLAVSLLCLLSSTSVADDIVVRAGEHEDFTRLVMQLPPDATWELEKGRGLARFLFDGLNENFDVTQTFDIIPRTRLSEVTATEGLLTLILACDCPVVTYFEDAQYLIVDIQNGPPIKDQAALPRPTQNTVSDRIPRSAFSEFELLWRDSMPNARPDADEPVAVIEPPGMERSRQQEKEVYLATQRALLEAYGEAISRGVVEVEDEGLEPSIPAPNETENDTEIGEVYDSSSRPEPPPVAQDAHIRVTSSRDVPTDGNDAALLELLLTDDQCRNVAPVDVPSWISSDNFSQQISLSNQELFDELGKLDPAAAIQRVKLYLYFGFGQEAAQIAFLIDSFGELHPELADMAQILEYGRAKNPRSLHRFANCESDLALWGILAADGLPVVAPVNAASAVLALEKLPIHLRHFLGQQLSKRLLDRGETEYAAAALRAATRTYDPSKPTLANAQLSTLSASVDQKTEALAEVTTSNTEEGPEAVIILVNDYIKRAEPVPADIALLTEAYLFEYQDAPIAPELLLAHALASSASGQLDKAFSALQALTDDDQQEKAISAANFLLGTLVRLDSHVEFLRNIMERGEQLGSGLDGDPVFAAATRLIDLGFPANARALVDQSEGMSSRQYKILSAKANLAEGNPSAAITNLQGMDDPDATFLRATALAQIGNNGLARDGFTKADRPDLARTSAWLSDQWKDTLDPADETFGAITSVAAERLPLVSQNDVMIQNSFSAVDSSQTARTTIQRLLQDLNVEE